MAGPAPSSAVVRRRMQQQQRRDTHPELELRRALHAAGLRYRVERPVIPGMRRRADIVFGPAKVAVFVDGCFWHMCPQHATAPKANAEWWREKLERNRARDRETDGLLNEQGWLPVRVWEHEDMAVAAVRVADVVRDRRQPIRQADPQA
jgi:DNA mismatch endonuclease (patch repair protein)